MKDELLCAPAPAPRRQVLQRGLLKHQQWAEVHLALPAIDISSRLEPSVDLQHGKKGVRGRKVVLAQLSWMQISSSCILVGWGNGS